MPKKTQIELWVRLACAGCVVLAGAVSCAPTVSFNVSGGWSGTMTWTSGPMTGLNSAFSIDVIDDEGDVTGSAEFSSGYMNTFEIPITRGEVHADTIVLEASGLNPITSPPTPVRFTFDGQVTATTMSGVGTQTVNSASYTFSWTATLVAPPPPEA